LTFCNSLLLLLLLFVITSLHGVYTQNSPCLGHLALPLSLPHMSCHVTPRQFCRSVAPPDHLSPFSPATFFFDPRIPRTHSSRSSVCTEVLGRGAVQFGTAAIVHNGSEPSNSRMYQNTRLHGVTPQKTAILITSPPKLPPFTRVQTHVSQPPAVTT
jgi:hypothetical protein